MGWVGFTGMEDGCSLAKPLGVDVSHFWKDPKMDWRCGGDRERPLSPTQPPSKSTEWMLYNLMMMMLENRHSRTEEAVKGGPRL